MERNDRYESESAETEVFDSHESHGAHAARPGAAQATTGVPLRGIGMIAIAVAVLILLWAVFFLGKGDDGATNTAADSTATSAAAAPAKDSKHKAPSEGATAMSATEESAMPSALSITASPSSEADRPQGETPAAEPDQPAPGEPGTPATPAPAAPSAAPAPDTRPVVNVLNNSTVQGLAADVAGRLTAAGNATGTVGNLPDVATPQSMVYYGPGDETAAKRVATELGIKYAPKIPSVEHYPGLVVVVTQDLQ